MNYWLFMLEFFGPPELDLGPWYPNPGLAMITHRQSSEASSTPRMMIRGRSTFY